MSSQRLRILLNKLDEKLDQYMSMKARGIALSDLNKEIADILREINREMPPEYREQEIAIIGGPHQGVVKVRELPELVEKGDERALKVLEALYLGR